MYIICILYFFNFYYLLFFHFNFSYCVFPCTILHQIKFLVSDNLIYIIQSVFLSNCPSGSVFLKTLVFPDESDNSYVEMVPQKSLNLRAFTLCMRVATELPNMEREIILFAYRTQDFDELNVWQELDGRYTQQHAYIDSNIRKYSVIIVVDCCFTFRHLHAKISLIFKLILVTSLLLSRK